MIHLMLHDDWEINGDGSGDPEKLMFDPARRILDICDRYGAKYTFYAEVGQQLQMLNSNQSKWRQYANTWETILKDAVSRGHDVQLHFHPQWIGAELNKDEWALDYSKWNTAKVEIEILDKWIGNGCQYLRHLLKSVNPNYQLLSYRAGGWMCQPSEMLYNVLKQNGIVCDVTVMKGRYKKYNDGGYIDFRDAVSHYKPWEVDPNDFSKELKGSCLWEIPVYTELSELPHLVFLLKKSFSPIHYYRTFRKVRHKKLRKNYSPTAIVSNTLKDYYGSFGYMHYRHLLSYINVLIKLSNKDRMDYPLIFLTHSKSFYDFKNFDILLRKIYKYQNINFSTTNDYIKNNLIRDF